MFGHHLTKNQRFSWCETEWILGSRRRGPREVCLGLGSMKTRVFSTNTQSRFVSVILGSVLLFLAFVVPETTHEVSLALQGFKTDTRVAWRNRRQYCIFDEVMIFWLSCIICLLAPSLNRTIPKCGQRTAQSAYLEVKS